MRKILGIFLVTLPIWLIILKISMSLGIINVLKTVGMLIGFIGVFCCGVYLIEYKK